MKKIWLNKVTLLNNKGLVLKGPPLTSFPVHLLLSLSSGCSSSSILRAIGINHSSVQTGQKHQLPLQRSNGAADIIWNLLFCLLFYSAGDQNQGPVQVRLCVWPLSHILSTLHGAFKIRSCYRMGSREKKKCNFLKEL